MTISLPPIFKRQKRRYTWRNEFSSPLPAGSVNGSRMFPGPGTLTAVDTENKLTIADGKLTFSGGKAAPAYGDPGAWTDNVVIRAAGVLIAVKFKVNDATSAIEFGLDTGKTGELAGHRVRITGDTLIVYDGTTAGPIVAIPTDGTECIAVFALRAAGCKVYLKCGTGYYEFLWSTNTLTTATLYAGVSNYSATAFIDFLRAINTKWLSVPVLSDSFTGAAGTMNGRSSDGLGHLETSGIGSGGVTAWAGTNGTVDGSGNLVITPTLGEELIVNGGFSAWTGDNPDNWSVPAEDANNYVTQDSAKARIVSDGTYFQIQQTFVTTAKAFYRVYVNTVAVASGSFAFILRDNTAISILSQTKSSSGQYMFCAAALSALTVLRFSRIVACDFTIDDASVKPITLSTCYLPQTFSTKDVYIKTTFSLIAGLQAGVIFGLSGTSFILAYLDGTNFKLEICESGVWAAAKATIANTAVTAVEMIIRRRGTDVWCYVNQVLMGTGPTTTLSAGENTNTSGLGVSPFSTNEANSFASFLVEAIGTANEHGILDRLI